jgi:hypothetical protein
MPANVLLWQSLHERYFLCCVRSRAIHHAKTRFLSRSLMKAEKQLFVQTGKHTMKKLFFLLVVSSSIVAQAQNTKAIDSIRRAGDTTLYGLPVHKSYVAPDAVERAKKKYGRALYSIEKSTAADCRESYLVGLIRNGRLTLEWMCDDPKMVWQRSRKTLQPTTEGLGTETSLP